MNTVKPRRIKATKDEQARYDRLKELPCIACHLSGFSKMCGKHEIQHFTAGGRRIGNDKTIPLGAWHHRGVILDGMSGYEMEEYFGPSFGKSRRQFEAHFGSEEFLLAETNKLIGA